MIATIPGVVRKGAASSYTSLNGHMFSFLDNTGAMSLRLPKDTRDQFLADHSTRLSLQHGAVMKEYVVVPDGLLANTTQLKPYFALSHAYIATLKAKPTTRKK